MKIALIAMLILGGLQLLASLPLTAFSMGTHPQTKAYARAWQEDHYDLSWYDPLKKSVFKVTAPDGYKLWAQRLVNPVPAERCVIISHGYTDNHFGALKYAKNYLDLGFDVVVYDLRGHGYNKRTYCTYTVRERKDLLAVIKAVKERWPQYKILGLHGESLGAATSVACLEKKPPVDFVVADCGFSEIKSVLKGSLKKMRIPGRMLRLTAQWARLRCCCSYKDMRPIDSLKDNTVPILFFPGTADELIAPRHSVNMAKETKGYTEIHLIKDAVHAQSVLKEPENYREYLTDFLRKCGII